MTPELIQAIEDGATVVTPNRRLARALKHRFDAVQRAKGRAVWRSADILPWGGWLERSFRDATRLDAAESLLTSAQELAVWQQAVEESTAGEILLDPAELARLARAAWDLQHAWALAPQSWRAGLPDDARHYLDWAGRYAQRCARNGWLDSARLPAALAARLELSGARQPRRLVCYGFDALTPQDRQLLAACAAAGVDVVERQPDRPSGQLCCRVFRSAEDELAAAAAAAREILLAAPEARIGIVVPELARRRADVVRILDDALEPARVLGGTRDRPRPYNLSLGLPLAHYPLVRSALSVLRMARGELSLHETGSLLRSPFIGAAEQEFTRRALLDARLRRLGRTNVSLNLLQAEAHGRNHDDAHACRALSALLTTWRERAQAVREGRRLPSAWSGVMQSLLAGLGWPGERTLDSEEYQTWRRWRELILELSQLDAVLGAITYTDALTWLSRLSAETLFQPESEDVGLQVLGVLESAGLSFDHLFVTGLHDEVLPGAARPNPLLPAQLQRMHNVPHASAQWELDFARRMMTLWSAAAPQVVFSYPAREDDRELGPSPVLAAIARVPAPARAGRYADAIHAAALLDEVADGVAPALAAGHEVSGGTSVFRDQAACPFRAFAIHRLGATELDEGRPGLDARERGTLLHDAMRLLWGEIGSHQQLVTLDQEALPRAVTHAVEQALAQMQRRRPDALSESFLVLERKRLCDLLQRALQIERQRAPFRVLQREQPYAVEIAGLRMHVRPDRIDLLEGGGSVILDYKSSEANPRSWIGARPDEPQLPLYALELRDDVAAVSFVTLLPERVEFQGLACADDLLPGVQQVGSGKFKDASDWGGLLRQWRAMRDGLAAEFLSGRAAVAPKHPVQTCRSCALQPLCRKAELFAEAFDGEEDGDA